MKIFLIGYMGSGKTTIAKKLSNKLNFKLLDVDVEIEASEGEKIPAIFSGKGESYFREKERDVLFSIVSLKGDFVISTGGGLPCFFDNMDIINSKGISVYLEASPKALLSRLSKGKESRPLLKDKSNNEMLTFIAEHLSEREVFYSKAKIKVNAFSLNSTGINELIAEFRV